MAKSDQGAAANWIWCAAAGRRPNGSTTERSGRVHRNSRGRDYRQATECELVHPDDQGADAATLARVHGRGKPTTSNTASAHRDGEYRWFKRTACRYGTTTGGPSGGRAASPTSPTSRQAEEALRESERRFRMFVDHASDAFFLLDDENGVILDVNRQACRSSDTTRASCVGMTPLDFDHRCHPDPTGGVTSNGVLDAGQAMRVRCRGTAARTVDRGFSRGDGAAYSLGGPVRFIGALCATSPTGSRAEEALRESEERFRGTFGKRPWDRPGRTEGGWTACCTYPPLNEEILVATRAKNCSEDRPDSHVHPEDLGIPQLYRRALRGRTRRPLPSETHLPQGRLDRLNWLDVLSPFPASGWEAEYAIVAVQETSERKRLEEELAAGEGGGGGGQPGQGRVPGQRQPRDPHPHERDPRHDRAGS